MQIELIEIRDHLSRFPPFDELPEEVLDDVARQVEIGYCKAGTQILTFNQEIHELRSRATDLDTPESGIFCSQRRPYAQN